MIIAVGRLFIYCERLQNVEKWFLNGILSPRKHFVGLIKNVCMVRKRCYHSRNVTLCWMKTLFAVRKEGERNMQMLRFDWIVLEMWCSSENRLQKKNDKMRSRISPASAHLARYEIIWVLFYLSANEIVHEITASDACLTDIRHAYSILLVWMLLFFSFVKQGYYICDAMLLTDASINLQIFSIWC